MTTKSITICLLAVAGVFAAVGGMSLSWRYVFVSLAVGIAIFSIMLVLRDLSKRLWDNQRLLMDVPRKVAVLSNVEAFAMHRLTQRFPKLSIPISGWSMRFSNLDLIIDVMDQSKPSVIVEMGSGISTLTMAAWAKEHGRGRVISFDHSRDWAEITRHHLEISGLSEFASVHVAPLAETEGLEGELLWYDLDNRIQEISDIDLLVVDGPPAGSADIQLSRFPALPKFASRLSPEAKIILDDANREGEKRVLEAWAEQYDGCSVTYIPTLSGLALVERTLSVND